VTLGDTLTLLLPVAGSMLFLGEVPLLPFEPVTFVREIE
jgi:hypothetical protein